VGKEAAIPEAPSDVLSPTELGSAFQTFTDTVRTKLMKAAAFYVAGTDFAPEDLLNEAVTRALAGERKCPRDVAPQVFLGNAMKSIAWARREQLDGEPDMENLDDVEGVIPAPARSAEREIVARQDCDGMLKALEELFADDEEVQLVIMGLVDGHDAEEIRGIGGWDPRAYATIRRRMRNKINKKYPGGWPR
jgi:DNA-directed RNA polymerase specialized sigma24 family protein